ncbi:hypothetical protein GCM10027081_02440 [Cupriavidus yeoncheonensis]
MGLHHRPRVRQALPVDPRAGQAAVARQAMVEAELDEQLHPRTVVPGEITELRTGLRHGVRRLKNGLSGNDNFLSEYAITRATAPT